MGLEWGDLPRLRDYFGKVHERPVPLGAMQKGLERAFSERAAFVVDSIKARIKGATSVRADLTHEGVYEWVFKITDAENADSAALALLVAKAPGVYARLARTEHQQLRSMHSTDRDYVPEPYAGGVLHVERPRAAAIFAYFAEWLDGFEEVAVSEEGALQVVTDGSPQELEPEWEEELRGRICEVLARYYDPARQTAVWPVEPASGDFVCRRTGANGDGAYQVKLVSPRGIDRRVPPARLVSLLNDDQWEWCGNPIRLAPKSLQRLEQALATAFGIRDGGPERGAERARRYISAYKALMPGKRRRGVLPRATGGVLARR